MEPAAPCDTAVLQPQSQSSTATLELLSTHLKTHTRQHTNTPDSEGGEARKEERKEEEDLKWTCGARGRSKKK